MFSRERILNGYYQPEWEEDPGCENKLAGARAEPRSEQSGVPYDVKRLGALW